MPILSNSYIFIFIYFLSLSHKTEFVHNRRFAFPFVFFFFVIVVVMFNWSLHLSQHSNSANWMRFHNHSVRCEIKYIAHFRRDRRINTQYSHCHLLYSLVLTLEWSVQMAELYTQSLMNIGIFFVFYEIRIISIELNVYSNWNWISIENIYNCLINSYVITF